MAEVAGVFIPPLLFIQGPKALVPEPDNCCIGSTGFPLKLLPPSQVQVALNRSWPPPSQCSRNVLKSGADRVLAISPSLIPFSTSYIALTASVRLAAAFNRIRLFFLSPVSGSTTIA